MRVARRAAPALLAVLLASCGPPSGREAAPARPVTPAAAAALAGGIPLVPGLALTLVPNLPGVEGEDVPDLARREVEVLEVEKGRLRLRWTGQVRVEKPESARRREDWVRARANAARGATPEPAIPAAYETRRSSFFPACGRKAMRRSPARRPSGSPRTRSPS
jgi:hypothetical protein